jgi:hypothetical protein
MRKIIYIVSGFAILILLIYSYSYIQQQKGETDIRTEAKNIQEKLTSLGTKQIEWPEQHAELQTTLPKVKLISKVIDRRSVEEFLKIVSVTDNGELNTSDYWEKGGEFVSINKSESSIKYALDLLDKSPPVSGTLKTSAEMIEIAQDLVKRIKSNGLDWDVKEVEYEKIVGSRFVSATEESGELYKITGVWKYKGIPILSPGSYPIVLRFSRDGKPVNVSVRLIDIEETNESIELNSEDKIREMSPDNIVILDIEGGENYDRSFIDPEGVEIARATKSYWGYVIVPNKEHLVPYLIMEGNSIWENEPIKVIMAAKAES